MSSKRFFGGAKVSRNHWILGLGCLCLMICMSCTKTASAMPTTVVLLRNQPLTVWVASTKVQQQTGLQGRTIALTQGMFFPAMFPAFQGVWMKNCPHSLDLIFLRRDGQGAYSVVSYVESALPCTGDSCPSVSPPPGSDSLLEVTGGLVSRISLAVGDSVGVAPYAGHS